MKNRRNWLMVDLVVQLGLVIGIFLPMFIHAMEFDWSPTGFSFGAYISLGAWQFGYSVLLYFLSGRVFRANYIRFVSLFGLAVVLSFLFVNVSGLNLFAVIGFIGMVFVPPFIALVRFVTLLGEVAETKEHYIDFPEHTERVFL